jgi:hypothetical protein
MKISSEILNRTYGHAKLTIDQMHSTRTKALAAGHLYYFTGSPCNYAHISPRVISGPSSYCYLCKKVYHDKKYDKIRKPRPPKSEEQKHEQKRVKLEKAKAYQKANIKKLIDQRHQFWLKNKARLNDKYKAYYNANKATIIESNKRYYQNNREEILARMKLSRQKKIDKGLLK